MNAITTRMERTSCHLLIILLGCAPWSALKSQTFINVAGEMGLDELVLGEQFGNGISFYDHDEDGWDDLTICTSFDSLVFYHNNNGQFVRSRSFVFAPGFSKHALWVDYDNDGDMDLTLTTWGGACSLFANNGSYEFSDVSVEVGLAQIQRNTSGVSWGDYDRDGDLDLYVCVYEFEEGTTDPTYMNHLYNNHGNGTFSDVSELAGVQDGIQMSFQSTWLDYDKDGWPDLFVINDRQYSNSMYHNNGNGTFSEVGVVTGTDLATENPMTISVSDFDHDDDLDIYTTNTGFFGQNAKLLVNNGDGTFTEEGTQFGVDLALWSWGAAWVDVDNDTWEDLYVTTSIASANQELNYLFKNHDGSGFEESSSLFAQNNAASSFAAVRGDVNNDGQCDLAVQSLTPYRTQLWQNQGSENNYIKVTLKGTASERMAVGSWIRVFANGERYTRYTTCGSDYLSQHSQHHIIGLGQADIVDSVHVEYVRGHTDRYYDLDPNRSYTFTEGETYVAMLTATGSTSFCPGNSVVLDAGEHLAYSWNTGGTSPSLTISAPGAYWCTVTGPNSIQVNTDTIFVSVLPTPVISSTTVNPVCHGMPTGSIAINNLLGIPAQSVTWSNGGTGTILNDLGEGDYSYTFIDTNGCLATGTIQLTQPPELFAQAFTTPSSANNGTLEVQVFGGVPPYTIALNGDPIGTSAMDLAAGEYVLQVTDDVGCTYEQGVNVDQLSGIAENGGLVLQFSPNPTERMIHIHSSKPGRIIRVQDGEGRLVRGPLTASSTVDLDGLAAGTYIIQMEHTDGTRSQARVFKLGER